MSLCPGLVALNMGYFLVALFFFIFCMVVQCKVMILFSFLQSSFLSIARFYMFLISLQVFVGNGWVLA